MYHVEIYVRVRRACMVEGMSVREASRVFGLHRDTVRKMLAYSAPPGYRRQDPPRRPRLEPFTGVIDAILEADRQVPRKQRHTAKRIFERLRDEHGFDGQYTIVKDYVRERRRRTQEMFVPLSHAPGHAQCDFGEARVIIGGVERKAHYLVLDLPHSDGCFVKAYPAETTEAFLDGHVSAFASLGGVPQSILYDNTKLAVARILGDGRRQRTRAFTELQSHYLFEDRFGRPGKGNDKGKVEGMVGYVRRNFLVPVPSFQSFDALNAHLEERCLARMDSVLRGHDETIGQRMERDLEALLPLRQDLILDEERFFAEFLLEGLLRGDPLTRSSFYTRALDAGWMTVNEVRKAENLNPLPDGNAPSPKNRGGGGGGGGGGNHPTEGRCGAGVDPGHRSQDGAEGNGPDPKGGQEIQR